MLLMIKYNNFWFPVVVSSRSLTVIVPVAAWSGVSTAYTLPTPGCPRSAKQRTNVPQDLGTAARQAGNPTSYTWWSLYRGLLDAPADQQSQSRQGQRDQHQGQRQERRGQKKRKTATTSDMNNKSQHNPQKVEHSSSVNLPGDLPSHGAYSVDINRTVTSAFSLHQKKSLIEGSASFFKSILPGAKSKKKEKISVTWDIRRNVQPGNPGRRLE